MASSKGTLEPPHGRLDEVPVGVGEDHELPAALARLGERPGTSGNGSQSGASAPALPPRPARAPSRRIASVITSR